MLSDVHDHAIKDWQIITTFICINKYCNITSGLSDFTDFENIIQA